MISQDDKQVTNLVINVGRVFNRLFNFFFQQETETFSKAVDPCLEGGLGGGQVLGHRTVRTFGPSFCEPTAQSTVAVKNTATASVKTTGAVDSTV